MTRGGGGAGDVPLVVFKPSCRHHASHPGPTISARCYNISLHENNTLCMKAIFLCAETIYLRANNIFCTQIIFFACKQYLFACKQYCLHAMKYCLCANKYCLRANNIICAQRNACLRVKPFILLRANKSLWWHWIMAYTSHRRVCLM